MDLTLNLLMIELEWHPLLNAALHDWGATSFSVRRRLGGGRSGAVVLLIDVATPGHDGQGVLKLSANEELVDEGARQRAARLVTSLADHVPEVTRHFAHEGRSAILLTVAGGGLLEADVMANLKGPLMNLCAQRISNSLLTEWNDVVAFDDGVETAGNVLSEWLGHRLTVEGRVPTVLREILNIPDDVQAFRYGGSDYPNPYRCVGHGGLAVDVKLVVGRGLAHGDLHSENILVRGVRAVEDYFFIDFSTSHERTPLFFDHAYLEIDLLLRAREQITHQRWHELCRTLSSVQRPQDASGAPNPEDQGLLWTLGMMRYEIDQWVKAKHPQRVEDLKVQLLLARIAAGLNFANKRSLAPDATLSNKKKFFSMLYAAEAARCLFEYCRIPIPTDGIVAQPQGELCAPLPEGWRDLWDACEGFQPGRGAYVLIASQQVGELPQHARKTIGRLPWSIVLDFDPKGADGAFVQDALPIISRERSASQIYPHQATTPEFEDGMCWLFADSAESGVERTAFPSTAAWRRNTLQRLRSLANELHRATAPRPTYVVVLGDGVETARLRNACAALEEMLGASALIVVLSLNSEDTSFEALKAETEQILEVPCDWGTLALGLHQMLGDGPDEKSFWLPVRDTNTRAVRRERLDPVEQARFAASLELVPASGSDYQPTRTGDDIADFYRGNGITWHELDLHRDVDRDVTGGPSGVLARVRAQPVEPISYCDANPNGAAHIRTVGVPVWGEGLSVFLSSKFVRCGVVSTGDYFGAVVDGPTPPSRGEHGSFAVSS